MPKESGIGDNFYAGAFNISGDINSVGTISAPLATLDVTDITQAAPERIAGLADGNIAFTALWNGDAGHVVPVLQDVSRTDVQLSYFHRQVVGNPAASMIAKKLSFDPTRGADGDLKIGVTAQANGYGLEWGKQLTAGVRTDTGAVSSGSGFDFTASTSFGWQAYIHLFAFTGTSVTLFLQDSADNVSFANIGNSGALTGATALRLQSATRTDTVRRYVRVTSSGTFTNAQFAVSFVKNTTATDF